MGRRHRIHFAGAVYHVMARGVNGCPIYLDDADRLRFLRLLNKAEELSGASIVAYCLMGNHFHLAMKVGLVPLAAIMQRLLTGYAQAFNERYQRTGHLFQARYKAILCLNDAYMLQLIRYIHENPVRAGLAAAPHQWTWSSAARVPTADAGMDGFDPWPESDGAQADLLRRDDRTNELGIIAERAAAKAGISVEMLKVRSKDRSLIRVKREMAGEAQKQGYSLTEIARWLGVGRSTVSDYCAVKSGNPTA